MSFSCPELIYMVHFRWKECVTLNHLSWITQNQLGAIRWWYTVHDRTVNPPCRFVVRKESWIQMAACGTQGFKCTIYGLWEIHESMRTSKLHSERTVLHRCVRLTSEPP